MVNDPDNGSPVDQLLETESRSDEEHAQKVELRRAGNRMKMGIQ